MANNQTISHSHVQNVLRRAGFTQDVIDEITAQLPDPIDLVRDEPVLTRYGVTRSHLTELLGGSP